jgi:hypothetical protein
LLTLGMLKLTSLMLMSVTQSQSVEKVFAQPRAKQSFSTRIAYIIKQATGV